MSTQSANRHWLRIAAPGILIAVASVAPGWAQEAPAPDASKETAPAEPLVTLDSGGVITPRAQAVLDRMTATLKSLQRYSVTAQITRDELLPFGYKLQNNESARMWVEAPNRLRMEVSGDVKNRTYVYDGSQITMFVPGMNVYSSTAAPGSIGELVRALLDRGVEMPIVDMLYHGYVGNVAENVRVGLVVGDSEVDGVQTDHLAFRQPDVDWQLWVEKGAQALPRKLLITTRYEVGDPQYQAVLRWDLKPRMPAKAFSFEPPADATKVPYHSSLVAGGGDQ